MSKKQLISSGILTQRMMEDDPENRIEAFIFTLDTDLPTSVVGTRNRFDNANGKAAIRAYADLLSHGIWDNPLTDTETGTLFLRADADMSAFYASDVGYITRNCQVPEFQDAMNAHFARFPNDQVAWVHRRNGKFHLTQLDWQGDERQERYVEWLSAAALGYNLEVRVVPFQEWAVAVWENLSIKSHEKRLEGRNKAYADAMERQNHRRKVYQKLQNGEQNIANAITVKLFGTGEEIDLMAESIQTVRVHTGRGNTELRTWDPGSFQSRAYFQTVGENRGWTVELDPQL